MDQLSAQLVMENRRPALLAAAMPAEIFEAVPEAPPGYRVEVVRDPAALQALAPEWNRLAAESGIEHPFVSHEWITTWWECFGGGRTLHVMLVRDGAKLVGIAPLVMGEERMYGMRIRCLQSPYNPHVPRFEFMIARDREAVYAAIWGYLRDHAHSWDSLKLCQVPAESELMRLLPPLIAEDDFTLGTWRGERSPYLVLDRSWDDYLYGLGRAHRKHVRNRLNRLSKIGEVGLEVISDAQYLDEQLSEGFQIEAAAWKGESGTAIVSQPEVERFYRSLAARAAAQGRLRLYFLTVDGARIAFSFALYHGNRLYSLKVGYDPAFRRYSPSTILCYMALRNAFDSGMALYDFLGNDEVWKMEWSPKIRPHDWLFVFAPSWRTRWISAVKFHWLPRMRQWRLYSLLSQLRNRKRKGPALEDDQD